MEYNVLLGRFNDIHNHKYCYSAVPQNVHRMDKIDIKCPLHGLFTCVVHDHLYNKSGCPECSRITKTDLNFIKKAQLKYNYFFDYSSVQYVNSATKVSILCPVHGIFKQEPYVHLRSIKGCPQCSIKRLSLEEFVNKAHVVHNFKYSYNNVIYVDSKTKVSITCPTHGLFIQTPDNHTRGSGCPQCSKMTKIRNTNWAKLSINRIKDNKQSGMLYLVEFNSPNDKFIKIGITSMKNSKYRFGIKHKGYTVTPLVEYNMNIIKANELEQQIITDFRYAKYTPTTKIGGYTECFDVTAQLDIISYIQQRLENTNG